MTITEEIQSLKKEKNAVILAHYYVAPEVQEIVTMWEIPTISARRRQRQGRR